MSEPQLTHVDESGKAQMVDVGQKPTTRRHACAAATVRMSESAAQAVRDNSSRKGDVLQVARLAAIGAAKRTDEWIPLCHSIGLDKVSVEFEWLTGTTLEVTVSAVATGKTGVEMEAMVACSCAALTIYDMCKAIDRTMTIESVRLLSKSGGQRGDYQRS